MAVAQPASFDVVEFRRLGWSTVRGAVTPEEAAGFRSAVTALFHLSDADKLRYASDGPLRPGFEPYGRSVSAETGEPNPVEAWSISIFIEDDLPSVELASPIAAMANRLHCLACETFAAIGQRLALPDTSSLVDTQTTGLQLIHYLAERSSEIERQQSLHSDVSLITLLLASNEPGLTIFRDGVEAYVRLGPTDVLVLAGLSLTAISAGDIPAPLHSVRIPENRRGSDRYSYPYFLNPRADMSAPNLAGDRTDVGNLLTDYRASIFGAGETD